VRFPDSEKEHYRQHYADIANAPSHGFADVVGKQEAVYCREENDGQSHPKPYVSIQVLDSLDSDALFCVRFE
jgi:hypothetical protein